MLQFDGGPFAFREDFPQQDLAITVDDERDRSEFKVGITGLHEQRNDAVSRTPDRARGKATQLPAADLGGS